MNAYQGKTAVITGGSTGMGFATAKLFADSGARVIITGRSQSRLDTALAQLGEDALAVRGDVASLSSLEALAEQVPGPVDALFVNAGMARTAPFESVTEEEFDEQFGVNVKGAYFTVQKLAPLLRSGAGVVLTTSTANVLGLPETSVYSASKAALRSMARTLAAELLPRGVRVNAISPGPIDTEILEAGMSAEEAARFKAARAAANPMKRLGTPDEIARAVAFLAFDATFTTGIELVVDGGDTQL
ncbi:short-chain dehydrogenase [Amycolatopsis sp. AA4]|uniref:SDR family oxidoreductase n=1 Tax=Actinomycetes TaxID=1760 RepID=UPI0001B58119|nr:MULTISPECIES: SDR family oxidoreductase [Actinomycetes]ATY14800.1 short-chain dehydrogenase [Amycolatopsis sp. AA4]EFL10947.1 2-hydroxycyclohexanecarboxyl-CoA dehydrogenase [Streptomyces sp. AA4]